MLELFRNFFGITDQDSDQAAREKIAGRYVLLDESLRDVLPPALRSPRCFRSGASRPADGPGEPPAPAPRRGQARDADVGPAPAGGDVPRGSSLVRRGSEAFLEPIVEALHGTQWLVLVNFRPEYHAAWMQKSYYQQLPLLPLGPEAIAELLRDLLGDDPSLAALGDRIRERTGGNPFFIEEVVQALAETGSLEGAKGAYRLVRPCGRAAPSRHGPGRARRSHRSARGAGEAGATDGGRDRQGVRRADLAPRGGAPRDGPGRRAPEAHELRSSSTRRRSIRRRNTPSSTR